MEVNYSSGSILAFIGSTIAKTAASANPATAVAAEGLSEVAGALFGGVEIEGDEKNIRNTLLRTIDRAWNTIQKKYDLTDSCMNELREEVMGKSTGVDSFIRNSQSQGLNAATALVIESILLRHVGEFKRSPKYTWTRAYTKNASKDIANTLIGSIEGVFKTNDSLMILKAIMDNNAQMRQSFQAISNQLEQISKGDKEPEYPHRLTSIPFLDPEVGLVGRDSIKEDVRRMLEENVCIVLVSGLGGIGKTAVMQEVCNDLLNEGNYVAWVRCGDSLRDDLLALRVRLGIPDSDSADDAYRKVLGIINRPPLEGKLYLFMDDLSRKFTEQERSDLRGLGIHVMITSRQENLHLPKLKLTELVEEYAIEMFYRYYGGDQDRRYLNAVKEIVNNARRHTLLVELIAKAAWVAGGTLDEFRAELEEKGIFDVFEGEIDENLTIEECVIRLYRISRLSGEQRRIMKLFTVFSPEKPIYDKVSEWAEFDINGISSLVELGWLEKVENGYQIHQIVKDSLQRQLQKEHEIVRLEDYGGFLDRVISTKDYLLKTETYKVVRERIGLTEDVAGYLWDEYQLNPEKDEAWASNAGALMNNLAGVYHDEGDYEKALEYHEKALAIKERVFDREDSDTAKTYNNMATVYYEQGEYEKALVYCGKALAIKERVLGPEHPDTAASYHNMGAVYWAHGDYEEALEYYGKALAINERVLGTEHPLTAKTYNNMGAVHYAKGDYEKALEYYKKALAVLERVLSTEHPDTAMTYTNMALLCDNGKALEYNGKALAIYERVLGTGHPLTAKTYNNTAEAYHDKGDSEKALEYYGKALAISERVLGIEHPSTATTYGNMATLYYDQGDYEKALEYYKKALAVRERVLSTEHPDTATTYYNMAWIYRNQGDYEKALEYYKKAYTIRLSVYGENHPDTQKTQLSIKTMEQKIKTGMIKDFLKKLLSQK